ncbi:MAG: YDG domain-containing protein, partial [Burkholderiaceae bacterium]
GANFVAGLIGFNYDGAISNTYAKGSVQGVSNTGGLMGNNYGTVTNSFWDTQTSGQAASVGGSGLTTQQMMQASSFSSWNTLTPNTIASTGNSGASWRIYEGRSAPLLTQFLTALTLNVPDVIVTYDGTAHASTSVVPGNVFTANETNAGSYAALYSNQQGYDISGTGTLTINKANLTLSGTRAYDGTSTVAGSVLTASGVNGETFAVTGSGDTTNLASKNVQTGSTLVNLTGLALDSSTNGGLSGNYNALSTTGSAVSIGKANLAVTGVTANNKTYDGTTSATLSGTAAVTAINSDVVSIGGSGSGVFADAAVGNGKAVTVTGFTLSGTDSGNYTIMQPIGVTADITAAVGTPAQTAAPTPISPVTANLLASLLSQPAGGQATILDLFSTITVTDDSGVTIDTTIAQADGTSSANSIIPNVTMKIGTNGEALQIMNGGVRLPADTMLNEEDK